MNPEVGYYPSWANAPLVHNGFTRTVEHYPSTSRLDHQSRPFIDSCQHNERAHRALQGLIILPRQPKENRHEGLRGPARVSTVNGCRRGLQDRDEDNISYGLIV